MFVRCQKCDSFFEIRESKLGPEGRKVRCAFCQNTFLIHRDPLSDEEVDPGLPQEEFERTMLLNLWNKPTVPQRELRAQFQREQGAAKTNGNERKEPSPPLSLAGMELEEADPTATLSGTEAVPISGKFWRIQVSREEKARLLRFSGWFEPSPTAEELSVLAVPWELFRAEPGADFIRPGHDKRFLAVILKGFVRVFRPTTAGQEVAVAMLGAGHSFGETTLFQGHVHRQRVTALTETTAMLLSDREFLRLAETQPLAFRLVVLEVGRRLAQCLQRIHGGPLTVLHPMPGEEGPNATVSAPEPGHGLVPAMTRHESPF